MWVTEEPTYVLQAWEEAAGTFKCRPHLSTNSLTLIPSDSATCFKVSQVEGVSQIAFLTFASS